MDTARATEQPCAQEHHGPPTVTIGVTGHRPGGMQQADLPVLRARLRECLLLVRNTAARRLKTAPAMVLLSPLAEGADRLAAEQALALGFALHAPLPFAHDEYVRDFATADSQQRFRQLLASAARVIELDGSRTEGSDAYTAVGRAVLAGSDLVLAVWDGREARGTGGTGQMVLEAIHRHLPTIWVRAHAPHGACLLAEDPRRGGFREMPLAELGRRWRKLQR